MTRPTGVFKQRNNYIDAMGKRYADTPKAVWAALALSLAFRLSGDGDMEEAMKLLGGEWSTLHTGGHLPQKPIFYAVKEGA